MRTSPDPQLTPGVRSGRTLASGSDSELAAPTPLCVLKHLQTRASMGSVTLSGLFGLAWWAAACSDSR
jgi:hypothetical protein